MAKMEKSEKFQLRAEKPKPVQVNRPVIIAISAVLLFFIIWAMINAFTVAPTKKMANEITVKKLAGEQLSDVNPAIQQLPTSYTDASGIKKYLHGTDDSNIVLLQKELTDLKTEHEMLVQQLLAMRNRPAQVQPEMPTLDPQTQQARSSGMFFSGVDNTGAAAGGADNAFARRFAGMPGTSSDTDTTKPIEPVTKKLVTFYNEQNDNAQKLAVMKAADNPSDIYDLHKVVTPVSPYEIQAGTIIPAVLITAIDTTLDGTVVAQVRENVFDTVTGRFLMIPKGSKIMGEYGSRISYGQRRVLLTFNRVIRPDGSSIILGKPSGSDLSGSAGIEGNVDNHWWRILGAATLSTLLSVGAGVAGDSYDNGDYNPRTGQRAFMGAASGISQVGQNLTNRAIDIQPTITLPAGYLFTVIVKKDMVLTPYKKRG